MHHIFPAWLIDYGPAIALSLIGGGVAAFAWGVYRLARRISAARARR
jgi:hypothetical protein